MSKDLDTNTIYEIFRACRLCGASKGYKMPINPSAVGFDCPEIDLRQKIRACVQIEYDEKMPPLICERCIGKIYEFSDFIEMCQKTNTKTRQRLGLPPQTVAQGVSDNGDCVLGVTEQILSPNIENVKPRPGPKSSKLKKVEKINTEVVVKKEEYVPAEKKDVEKEKPAKMTRELEKLMQLQHLTIKGGPRPSRDDCKAPPEPPQATSQIPPQRSSRSSSSESKHSPLTDHIALSRLRTQEIQKRNVSTKPKPVVKNTRELKSLLQFEDDSVPLAPRGKRPRENSDRDDKDETPAKRVKVPTKPVRRSPTPPPKPPPKPAVRAKPGPKSRTQAKPDPKPKAQAKPAEAPAPALPLCVVCGFTSKAPQGMASHMRCHIVTYTSELLACNPCGAWFDNAARLEEHHKEHSARRRPYRCRGCRAKFLKHTGYTEHMEKAHCVPYKELPDIECGVCLKSFPTQPIFDNHKKRCEPAGGKCSKCNRHYATLKNLKRHEATCREKLKHPAEVKVSPEVRSRLAPLEARLVRCDQLLKKPKNRRHYNVRNVPVGFDLDRKCTYPYRSIVQVKKEKLDRDKMVVIDKDIQSEFYKEEDYVHWDSDNSSDSDEEYSLMDPTVRKKKLPSLTALALKTLYSKRCIGKVPKRLRKVKTDKFDLFNDFDNVQSDISNIISNLDNSDAFNEDKVDKLLNNIASEENSTHDSDSLLETKKDDKFDFNAVKLLETGEGDEKFDFDAVKLIETAKNNDNIDFDAVKLVETAKNNDNIDFDAVKLLETAKNNDDVDFDAVKLLETAKNNDDVDFDAVKLLETAKNNDDVDFDAVKLVETAKNNDNIDFDAVKLLETAKNNNDVDFDAVKLVETTKHNDNIDFDAVKLLETAKNNDNIDFDAVKLVETTKHNDNIDFDAVKLLETTKNNDNIDFEADKLLEIAKNDENIDFDAAKLLETEKNNHGFDFDAVKLLETDRNGDRFDFDAVKNSETFTQNGDFDVDDKKNDNDGTTDAFLIKNLISQDNDDTASEISQEIDVTGFLSENKDIQMKDNVTAEEDDATDCSETSNINLEKTSHMTDSKEIIPNVNGNTDLLNDYIDEKILLEDLDAEIGSSGIDGDKKFSLEDLVSPDKENSLDLDPVSDSEFVV